MSQMITPAGADRRHDQDSCFSHRQTNTVYLIFPPGQTRRFRHWAAVWHCQIVLSLLCMQRQDQATRAYYAQENVSKYLAGDDKSNRRGFGTMGYMKREEIRGNKQEQKRF